MTQEDKDLLIVDLCGRLPYNVIVEFISYEGEEKPWFGKLSCKDLDCFIHDVRFIEIKPYLFPLSSMTEEQIEELKELCNMFNPDYYHPYAYWGIGVLYRHILDDNYKFNFKTNIIDWFHKHHFDYRGLIEKGLAKDTTELNIY